MTNIAQARSTALNRLHQLKPLIAEVDDIDQRRLILTSSVISILRYCAPLYAGQTDTIKSIFHTAIMRVNRVIYNQNTFRTRCEKICRSIRMPMPKEILVKDSVILMHKLIVNKKPAQLYKMLQFPTRQTRNTLPQLNNRPDTERAKRGTLPTILRLYSSVPPNVRDLDIPAFKSIIARHNYQVLAEEFQRN